MRLVMQEQAYETPLVSGMLRYMRAGRLTGTVEQWRLSTAPDDHLFLRIDLDARAADGDSYLYHLVVGPDRRPVRLNYRFVERRGAFATGTVQFSDGELTSSRTVYGARFDETVPFAAGTQLLLPATTGLAWLAAGCTGASIVPAVTLDMYNTESPAGLLAPVPLTLTAVETGAAERQVTVGWNAAAPTYDEPSLAPPAALATLLPAENLHWRTITLSADGWPVHLLRNDGLTAIAAQISRYGGVQ